MKRPGTYSRRQFFQVGAAGVAASVVTASGRGEALARVQSPPPAITAPRVLRKPPLGELQRIAQSYNLELSPEDLVSFRNLMDGVLASYRRLDQFAEPTLPVKYRRDPGYRPSADENRLNAWYWRCAIKGASSGPLAGKKVAIKDNVCVAGIPMMNGSNVLEGYVPDVDATIVTRILDAGGEIVGKAVCEHLCFSGGSHTSDTGPVLNPHDPKRSAGGSSSGSAALVVAGECDMAMGGDQGGSIRIPSAFCGAVGHKPTYGLVPYTGVFPIELTLDHTGPIARTAADCALLLEAIAGPDGLDPRQSGGVRTEPYTRMLTGDARGLRLGIVREGFGWPNSEPDVDRMVRDAAQRLGRAGAEVTEVSVPLHRDGIHIWNAIAVEGATMLMVAGNSMGTNWKGHYTTSLLDFYGRSRRVRGNDLSETVKLVILLGQYMQDNYQGRYYAKAQNLARVLRAAYDEALQSVDLLVMPTLPMKATLIPPPNASREEYVARALEMITNTCPFDVTGHPAVTVPAGMSAGLPVGMMLLGRHWEDGTVLRAADAFQRLN
ncbi:MAG: Asp-tRNA(Asn)/Glu-tRNA(Gln) amidotransferase GatCAB subunit A [Candidatus Rokuibacteriota bacterium]|nr:MAG: Asp-tRNA(Asn)/Glu-tRNA(Gln) amidotransferase GatCAB subunit A [Candidatus Rokubacteria bacterium]